MEKLKWGIISTSNFARRYVIPAIKHSTHARLYAISSRDHAKAQETAQQYDIPVYHASYEALLEDPDIDVIYNPLPPHMHVEWTRKGMLAGKHVLCEKPLALKATDIDDLIQTRDKMNVKAGEAFMVRTHPQWLKTKELIQNGHIGALKAIQGFFSFYNDDPGNIRNIKEYGGGSLWDIGCYPITLSRFITNKEPRKVQGLIQYDPTFQTDTLSSAILDFQGIHASFTASTLLVPYQRMMFFGTQKRLEVKIPFNAPNNSPCEIFLDDGDFFAQNGETIPFDICDQYTIEIDAFSHAVINDQEVPVSLENAKNNVKVIEALYTSGETGKWEFL